MKFKCRSYCTSDSSYAVCNTKASPWGLSHFVFLKWGVGQPDKLYTHYGVIVNHSFSLQVIRQVLNHGVLVVLWLVSPVSEEVVPIVPVRVLMVTCVVVDVCLPPPGAGAVGIARSTLIRNVSHCARPSLLRVFRLWWCPKVNLGQDHHCMVSY